MKQGLYKTEAGSTVSVQGKHGGIYHIDFDWVEEKDACLECHPTVYDCTLWWACQEHSGSAELKIEEPEGE